jgi:hypothetical protein
MSEIKRPIDFDQPNTIEEEGTDWKLEAIKEIGDHHLLREIIERNTEKNDMKDWPEAGSAINIGTSSLLAIQHKESDVEWGLIAWIDEKGESREEEGWCVVDDDVWRWVPDSWVVECVDKESTDDYDAWSGVMNILRSTSE